MFTGMIQEIGSVLANKKLSRGARLLIQAPSILGNLKTGDSIAVNGVCLTISELNDQAFVADISPETLKRTYFASLEPGGPLNLEPALQLGQRLDGHVVTGHIDGVVKLESWRREGTFTTFHFQLPTEWSGRIVHKGSVAVDGVSLTVAECEDNRCSVALIPRTLNSTILQYKKQGDPVHIELDIIGKYIEGLMQSKGAAAIIKKRVVTQEFLQKYGY